MENDIQSEVKMLSCNTGKLRCSRNKVHDKLLRCRGETIDCSISEEETVNCQPLPSRLLQTILTCFFLFLIPQIILRSRLLDEAQTRLKQCGIRG